MESPLLLITDETVKAFNIDEPRGEYVTADVQMVQAEDIYRNIFYKQRHCNFIGTKEADPQIISVLKVDQNGSHRCLKTTKKGYEEFSIPSSVLKFVRWTELEDYLNKTQADCQNYYLVSDPEFRHELVTVEQKHRQCYPHMKLAIIYCKPDQNQPADMFKNEKGNAAFDDFVNLMGSEINLNGWTGYSGDQKGGTTLYDKWRDIEVIYHVSVKMGAEGHRRLIGNDVPIIFFRDEGSPPFDICNVTNLGTMPQVFIVVQPHNGKYRIASFSRKTIKTYLPVVPAQSFDAEQAKNLILSKLYNGFVMATIYCPPIHRLWFTPRQALLAQIAGNYPKETPKTTKARLKKEKDRRARLQLESKEKKELIITLCAGQNLAIKDTIAKSSDPYVMLTMYEQEVKSKVVKITLNPVWNEDLKLNLHGVDFYDAEVVGTVMDWNLVSGHEFMGQFTIPLEEIIEKHLNHTDPVWFKLQPREKGESVSGELALRFSFEGKLDPDRDPVPPPNARLGPPGDHIVEGSSKKEKKSSKRTTPPRQRKLSNAVSRNMMRGSEGSSSKKKPKELERTESDPVSKDDGAVPRRRDLSNSAPGTPPAITLPTGAPMDEGSRSLSSGAVDNSKKLQVVKKREPGNRKSMAPVTSIRFDGPMDDSQVPVKGHSRARSGDTADVSIVVSNTAGDLASPARASSSAVRNSSRLAAFGGGGGKKDKSKDKEKDKDPQERTVMFAPTAVTTAPPSPGSLATAASPTAGGASPLRTRSSSPGPTVTVTNGPSTSPVKPPAQSSLAPISAAKLSGSPASGRPRANSEVALVLPDTLEGLLEFLFACAAEVIQHLFVLQTHVKDACTQGHQDEQQTTRFAQLSTETLHLIIDMKKGVEKLDTVVTGPPTLFFKKNTVVQHGTTVQTSTVALVKQGKQIIQALHGNADPSKQDLPGFTNAIITVAQALKVFKESLEQLRAGFEHK